MQRNWSSGALGMQPGHYGRALEMAQLEKLEDPRLSGTLQAMTVLRAEIVAAVAAFPEPPTNGG